ncbi:unnamed protein product [Rhizophagus irregularis]|nr:unnamed protein product [Rhizophagus irregularis]
MCLVTASYFADSRQKDTFTSEVFSLLSDMFSFPYTLTLNQIWHQFKTALLSACCSHFPKKTIFLMKLKAIPHELQPYIHLSYSLDHFIMSLQKLTSIFCLSHPLQLPIIFNSSNCILGSIPQIFTEVKAQKRYSLLEQFSESLYDSIMSHISISELREVISASLTHKAFGPSSIPYEWFKLLSDTSL